MIVSFDPIPLNYISAADTTRGLEVIPPSSSSSSYYANPPKKNIPNSSCSNSGSSSSSSFASVSSSTTPLTTYYLCVLDFEATCWDGGKNKDVMEIIEFPSVLYRVREKYGQRHETLLPTITAIITITIAILHDYIEHNELKIRRN